jgi:hypothetical protein
LLALAVQWRELATQIERLQRLQPKNASEATLSGRRPTLH